MISSESAFDIVIEHPPESESDKSHDQTTPITYFNKPDSVYTEYREFAKLVDTTYMNEMTYYSITLDLISLYLKSQRVLYVESKTFCEQCLYGLMLPTIFISATCSVLSIALKNTNYGSIISASLNAFNSFNLALITYLKLDAKAEAHKATAYQFDKLTTLCEFYSGKVQMYKDTNTSDKVKKFVDNIEKKVSEIKDVNQFIIPEIIRLRYSNFYTYNVFEIMRKFNTYKVMNTHELLELDTLIKEGATAELLDKRKHVINNIIEYRNMTSEISISFKSDLNKYSQSRRKQFCFSIFMCLKT